MPLQATSGAASYDAFGGGVPIIPNYIEEVFSTWLYTGNGSTQTITNGIDLAGKGGLTWIKSRSGANSHVLVDTVRGATKFLRSNSTNAEVTDPARVSAFTASGFTVGSDTETNGSGSTYASWTFREQPKFFDVVTYTGSGANRTIAHNLGSVPGCIIVKRTDAAADWQVYHNSLANTQYMVLNSTSTAATGATRWNSTTPTSTVFSLGTDSTVNASGGTYVAYLFGHDSGGFGLSGTDNVISCGSFTTDASANAEVTLGWEPQWVLYKTSASNPSDWSLLDNMRGWSRSSGSMLKANLADADAASFYGSETAFPTQRGFKFANAVLSSSTPYIYIAIRRPMKVPTTGTQVYNAIARTGTGAAATVTGVGFVPDLLNNQRRDAAGSFTGIFDRLRGSGQLLYRALTDPETNSQGPLFDKTMDGFGLGTGTGADTGNQSSATYIWHAFRRAPGFFDEVCYTGTAANRTVTHNLRVVPEFMIVKIRTGFSDSWFCYHAALGATQWIRLDSANAPTTQSTTWNNTAPTSSVFTLGTNTTVNRSASEFVAYLFASASGVSKVGSYTGNGSSQTINCGFTTGARFVLIRRTDSAGDWYVWDTARGIVAGNDPHLSMNTTAAEVTSNDTIDTDSTGFVVNQVAATNVNVNAATYIFLAIA